MEVFWLVKLGDALGEHVGHKQSTISTYCAQDGKFLRKLADGGGCTVGKAKRVLGWFSDNWPEDLEWPSDIPRPQKNKKKRAA